MLVVQDTHRIREAPVTVEVPEIVILAHRHKDGVHEHGVDVSNDTITLRSREMRDTPREVLQPELATQLDLVDHVPLEV